MEINKILKDCVTLENTINVLMRDNSTKEYELTRIQGDIFECTKVYLEDTLEKERELQNRLDEVVSKRQSIEDEIKQYTTINEKLSELVSCAQKRNSQDVNDDTVVAIVEANEEYLQARMSFERARNKLKELEDSVAKESREIQKIMKENCEVVVTLHKNDKMIRMMEQQNKYAEQQFDLVLSQLPWEPLTSQYIDNLMKSPNQTLRELAAALQVQAAEIEDLNDSLKFKKKKKLEALEGLLDQLSNFIQRREEAVMVARLTD